MPDSEKAHVRLLDLPTETLLEKFGAGGHKPGSGSAAALLGVVACKLLRTVVALTNGRTKYAAVHSQLALVDQTIIDELEPVLLEAVQRDSEVFDRVIAARRARDAATEAPERRRLRERALTLQREATQIPVEIAERCLEVGEQGLQIFDLGFTAARGDSSVGIAAALSGASGAVAVVYLNLKSFRGGAWAVDIRQRTDEIRDRYDRLHAEFTRRISVLRSEVLANEDRDGGEKAAEQSE